jgi:hypothetical protein
MQHTQLVLVAAINKLAGKPSANHETTLSQQITFVNTAFSPHPNIELLREAAQALAEMHIECTAQLQITQQKLDLLHSKQKQFQPLPPQIRALIDETKNFNKIADALIALIPKLASRLQPNDEQSPDRRKTRENTDIRRQASTARQIEKSLHLAKEHIETIVSITTELVSVGGSAERTASAATPARAVDEKRADLLKLLWGIVRCERERGSSDGNTNEGAPTATVSMLQQLLDCLDQKASLTFLPEEVSSYIDRVLHAALYGTRDQDTACLLKTFTRDMKALSRVETDAQRMTLTQM